MTGPALLVSYFAGLTAVFGLLIGSFLNVVVYRVPAGLSVVRPRSACPNCGHEIRGRDNVPVLSWLVLRGRCRDCATPISARYPAVELVTALAFVIVFARFWPTTAGVDSDVPVMQQLLLLGTMLFVMAISVALALIDLDTQRLPDAIVLPSYAVVIVCGAGMSLLSGDWGAFVRGLTGMAALGIFYLVLAIAVPRGMGLGDVKLAGVLGFVLAYLGWGPLAVGAFGAFLLGGTFSIVLMVLRRVGRKSGIPFGPWMLAGAWCGIFFGDGVLRAYLSLIGLG
jgi:leader peptidase (prepilin peptidase) / N-methyltransferase